MSQIKDITYDLLKSKGECTLREIREYALREQINIPPKSTIIRTTMYQLTEKDPNIQRIARGKYRYMSVFDEENKTDIKREELTPLLNNDYHKESVIVEDENLQKLDRIETELIVLINELENFKWFQSDELEIKRIRKSGRRLKELYKNIGERVDKLSL
jgi:mRNA-degrading endonuclease RelE of RelBE toxin-antitoxin system